MNESNFNWDWLWGELDAAEEMEQSKSAEVRAEGKARTKLLQEISVKAGAYEEHLRQWEHRQYLKSLQSRGIKFTQVKNPSSIKTKWSKMFTGGISGEKKKQIYYDQFRWHVFSYELLGSLKKENAELALKDAKKSKVWMFYQHLDQAYLIEGAEHLMPEDLVDERSLFLSDVYLFDEKERWTYIRTHEEMCGPYFYQAE